MIHPFSLVSFASFMMLLFFSMSVFRSNPLAPLNRVFAAMTLCWSVIAFAYTFMYSTRSLEELVFWKNIASFGWFLIPGVTVHATLFLVIKDHIGSRWWIYPALYLPGCVFLAHELSGSSLVLGHIIHAFGGPNISPEPSLWFVAFVVYGFTYFAASLLMVFHWKRTTASENEKWQSRMILALGITVLTVGSVTDGVLPLMNIALTPPLAPALVVFWLGALWIAIIRFELFDITPAMVSRSFLRTIDTYQTLMENFTDII